MKSETVNPMPATVAMAIIIGQVAPSGRRAMPVRAASQAAPAMPSVLPTTRPTMTPAVTAVAPGASKASALMTTPALARAKTGTIRKLDHGCSTWAMRSAGDTEWRASRVIGLAAPRPWARHAGRRPTRGPPTPAARLARRGEQPEHDTGDGGVHAGRVGDQPQGGAEHQVRGEPDHARPGSAAR